MVCCAMFANIAHAKSDYRLVGYVANAAEVPHIDAEKLTAINFAFAHIGKAQQIVLDEPGSGPFIAQLRKLKTSNPKLKLLLSIGGWGADGFSNAALNEVTRGQFAQSAAEVISRSGIDGIDIDWEYPGLAGPGIAHRDEDKQHFTALLRAIRVRFDGLAKQLHRAPDNPYLLTVALADGEFVSHVALDEIHPYLDWINLMTYDFHNSLTKTTGHHAAFSRSKTSVNDERSVEHAVDQFLTAGVPAAKLVVGVPFYGRAFTDVTAQNNGLDQPYGHYDSEYPWSKLVSDFIDRNGYKRYWDNAAKAPYLWNAEKRTFVTYDDPQSLKIKAEFVRKKKLGGMMYWEQSHDPNGELVGVLSNALK
jgi:chitinase